MIRKGEVYRLRASTDSQQDALLLVVSGTASNRSSLPTVTTLMLMPRADEIEPSVEVAFEVEDQQVMVGPHGLTSVPKEALENAPAGRLEGTQLAQIDKVLASYFDLSPASFGAPSMMDRPEKREEGL